jgi:hypothetical protein
MPVAEKGQTRIAKKLFVAGQFLITYNSLNSQGTPVPKGNSVDVANWHDAFGEEMSRDRIECMGKEGPITWDWGFYRFRSTFKSVFVDRLLMLAITIPTVTCSFRTTRLS